jgi:hypothetical protein
MPDTKQPNHDPRQPKKKQGSTEFEREGASEVGNDNDLDLDLDEADRDDDAITQRNPRMGEQGQQGQRQMDRGRGGTDRDGDDE